MSDVKDSYRKRKGMGGKGSHEVSSSTSSSLSLTNVRPRTQLGKGSYGIIWSVLDSTTEIEKCITLSSLLSSSSTTTPATAAASFFPATPASSTVSDSIGRQACNEFVFAVQQMDAIWKDDIINMYREILALQTLSFVPNAKQWFPVLHRVTWNTEKKSVSLFMSRMHSTLSSYMNQPSTPLAPLPFSEITPLILSQRLQVASAIVKGVATVFTKALRCGVFHRDAHEQNIMFTRDPCTAMSGEELSTMVQLVDFGSSRLFPGWYGRDQGASWSVTPQAFSSIEQLCSIPFLPWKCSEADVPPLPDKSQQPYTTMSWSLGCLGMAMVLQKDWCPDTVQRLQFGPETTLALLQSNGFISKHQWATGSTFLHNTLRHWHRKGLYRSSLQVLCDTWNVSSTLDPSTFPWTAMEGSGIDEPRSFLEPFLWVQQYTERYPMLAVHPMWETFVSFIQVSCCLDPSRRPTIPSLLAYPHPFFSVPTTDSTQILTTYKGDVHMSTEEDEGDTDHIDEEDEEQKKREEEKIPTSTRNDDLKIPFQPLGLPCTDEMMDIFHAIVHRVHSPSMHQLDQQQQQQQQPSYQWIPWTTGMIRTAQEASVSLYTKMKPLRVARWLWLEGCKWITSALCVYPDWKSSRIVAMVLSVLLKIHVHIQWSSLDEYQRFYPCLEPNQTEWSVVLPILLHPYTVLPMTVFLHYGIPSFLATMSQSMTTFSAQQRDGIWSIWMNFVQHPLLFIKREEEVIVSTSMSTSSSSSYPMSIQSSSPFL